MEEAYENGRKDLKLLIMKTKSTKMPKIYIKRKIYEVVIAKDKKTVNDKNEEGSSQIKKIVYQRLTVKIAERLLRI